VFRQPFEPTLVAGGVDRARGTLLIATKFRKRCLYRRFTSRRGGDKSDHPAESLRIMTKRTLPRQERFTVFFHFSMTLNSWNRR